jgi:hypothetical protein
MLEKGLTCFTINPPKLWAMNTIGNFFCLSVFLQARSRPSSILAA